MEKIFGSGDFKQVILVRTDLKLPKGKMAVQVAHASVDCVLHSVRGKVMRWRRQGGKKIVLKVRDQKELTSYFQEAKDAGLKAKLITDAGLTTVEPGTTTCCGIGPDISTKIDEITKDLKMM